MKIILLRDIKNIGRKYEVKEVNDGFARNGLIAKGSALPATPDNMGRMRAEMDKVVNEAKAKKQLIEQGLKELNNLTVTLSGKNNADGHLFAAIHTLEIAREIEKVAGIKIEPSWIELAHPIKTVGEHKITIKIDGHKAVFTLVVTPA